MSRRKVRVKVVPCLFGMALGLTISFTLSLLFTLYNSTTSTITLSSSGATGLPATNYYHPPSRFDQQLEVKRAKYLLIVAVAGQGEYLNKTLVQDTWGCCEYNESIVYYRSPLSAATAATNNTTGGGDQLDTIIENLCTKHINLSQWYTIVPLNLYLNIQKVESVLEPFDPTTPLYFSFPTANDDRYYCGVCDNGGIQILSKGLLRSLCSVYRRCSAQTKDCVLTGVKRVCSATPVMQVLKEHVCVLPPSDLQHSYHLGDKQVVSPICAIIIIPTGSLAVLYRIHRLMMEDRINKSIKALGAIQQKMDNLRYLLQETSGMSIQNEPEEDDKEKVSVWNTYSRGSVMGLTEGEAPVVNRKDCTHQINEAVDMTMNIVNSIDSRSSHILHRMRDSYYRWTDKGLRLVLNLEVRERGASMESAYCYQAQLERSVYPLSQTTLNPPPASIKQLTILVVVTDSYATQLKAFVDSLIGIIPHSPNHIMKLCLVVVHMEHSIANPTDAIHNALKANRATILDIKTVKTPHKLSRSHALLLAIKEITPADTVVLLADINLRFSLHFLTRCMAYPGNNKRVYVPFPTVKQSTLIQMLTSHLFPGEQLIPNTLWVPFTDIMCIEVGNLISVVTETSKTFREVVNVRTLPSILSEKGYQVLQGPDEGLEWIIENEANCDQALIGEPCEKVGGVHDDEFIANLVFSYHTAQQIIL